MPSLRPGVASVTFRGLGVEEVARLAAQAELPAVEWGADVHAPPGGDVSPVLRACAEHGAAVASYGSYLVAGGGIEQSPETVAVVATAVALGAPRIRVWAGRVGSVEVTAEQRRRIVRDLQHVADLAGAAGVDIGLEYHGSSLTDEPTQTLRLLDDVARQNVWTYWQPPVGLDDAAALRDLQQVVGRVSTVHVFAWSADLTRHPLSSRSGLWAPVLEELGGTGRSHDVLLEFVEDADGNAFGRDARVLRDLVMDVGGGRG